MYYTRGNLSLFLWLTLQCCLQVGLTAEYSKKKKVLKACIGLFNSIAIFIFKGQNCEKNKRDVWTIWLSRQPFIRSTSHLVGVLLRLFGWAVLEKASSSNTEPKQSARSRHVLNGHCSSYHNECNHQWHTDECEFCTGLVTYYDTLYNMSA